MSSKSPQSGIDAPSDSAQATGRDWRGLGDLIDLATERLTAPIEGIHDAIADRWFGLAGRRGVPVRMVYRSMTTPIYRSVRLAGSAVGTAVGLGAIAVASRKELRPLWHSPRGSGIQAVVNAVWGDELDRRGSSMSIDMGLRDVQGELIGLDADSLALAFPEPSPRLVVLVHGLGETERCWQGRAAEDGSEIGLAGALASDSFSPLLVRYNTGRHVSDNGVALAALLDEISRVWPVSVEEVALVGHSMGGLVARSAVYAGQEAGHGWVGVVRHVVALGSPHLGSPIEKGANIASWGLGLVPESRPLGEFLNHRSAGIKDLRFGAIVWSSTSWLV
ncbi:MAG: esterase/lipase family protein [Acidimicrobiia bacterium]